MEKYSDKVTFVTVKNAPENFDFWTFFWTFPKIDRNASLEYIVFKPDGKEYYHYKSKVPSAVGEQYRSDFGKKVAGGSTKALYNKKIKIMFIVNKGKIKFNPKDVRNFTFQFSKTVKAAKIK